MKSVVKLYIEAACYISAFGMQMPWLILNYRSDWGVILKICTVIVGVFVVSFNFIGARVDTSMKIVKFLIVIEGFMMLLWLYLCIFGLAAALQSNMVSLNLDSSTSRWSNSNYQGVLYSFSLYLLLILKTITLSRLSTTYNSLKACLHSKFSKLSIKSNNSNEQLKVHDLIEPDPKPTAHRRPNISFDPPNSTDYNIVNEIVYSKPEQTDEYQNLRKFFN